MLSHNNSEELLKKNAPKKQRYTIKKLSVGVASVLLGVSFASSVSADTGQENTTSNINNDATNQNDQELSAAPSQTYTLKNNGASATNATSTPASASTAVSATASSANFADRYEAAVEQGTQEVINNAKQALEANSSANSSTANSAESSASSSTTNNALSAATDQLDTSSAATSGADSSATTTLNIADLSSDGVAADQLGTSLVATSSSADSSAASSSSSIGLLDIIGALGSVATSDTGKTIISDFLKGNPAKAGRDAKKALENGQLGTDVYNSLAKLLSKASTTDKTDTNVTDENGQKVVEVSDWATLVKYAADNDIDVIQLTNDITASSDLNLNRTKALLIESSQSQPAAQSDDATATTTPATVKYKLNMGPDAIKVATNSPFELKNVDINSANTDGAVQSTDSNAQVTLNNVTVSGGPLFNGKGTLIVQGDVTNNYEGTTAISDAEFKKEIGSDKKGINYKNWGIANVVADNVTVDKNAHLTLSRTQNGDGIVLTGGNTYNSKGVVNGTAATQGTLNVADNAKLDITLANGTNLGHETNYDTQNANTAVWASHNGNLTTGVGAEITINAGHGRGIIFDEPFGGTRTVQSNTMGDWARTRYSGGSSRDESNANNTMQLGNFTKLTINSRDGIMLGNNAKMNTGEHSTVNLNNYGNGIGLQADAYCNIVIGPHTDFEMRSDGKDKSGIYNAANYIGLGENAQFTVDHDATFRFKVKNACQSNSHPYADNFNIVSVVKGSNPTVNIENNAIFDGESDYKNVFGEILSFSYNSAPRTSTVNINGARYVNFQRDGASTPGAWQNVQAKDPQGKHSGNLFYSWPANTWNVNGNTYNVYKWTDETESTDTFDASTYDKLIQSIKDLNQSSSEYWTQIQNLTLGVNMHRSNLTNISPNGASGKKNGWSADDKKGHGFDTEFSQRLALVATHIPTEDDNVQDTEGQINTVIQYDSSLKPGQVKVIQEGKAGRTITVNRTYYNVDVSDPDNVKRTIDTTKGTNGHDTYTYKLGDAQDRIIAIAPETATINYVDKDGNPIKGSDGKAIVATVTASPVVVDENGDVTFDDNGNPTAAEVNYNEASDLKKAEAAGDGYTKVANQDTDSTVTDAGLNWDYAISDAGKKANKNLYNIDGITKDAILNATKDLAQGATATIKAPNGPVYKVVLQPKEKQAVNVTVNYVDDDNNGQVITVGNKTYSDNLSGKPSDPMNYTTDSSIKDITSTGKYREVKSDFPTDPKFPDKATTYTVHFVHVITPVDHNTPDPHGNDGLKQSDLQKTATEKIHYVLDDGSANGDKTKMPAMHSYDSAIDDITRTVTYNGTGYVDAVTGKLVNAKQDADGNWVQDTTNTATPALTWAPATDADKTFKGADTKVAEGYFADTKTVPDKAVTTNDDGTPKDADDVYVVYKEIGKIVPIDKATGKPIPGQAQPKYENDPTDPTKVVPTSKTPEIPGYNLDPKQDDNVDPTNKTVTTPTDPSKDTNVVYSQVANDQNAVLKLYDDTSMTYIDLSGKNTTADTNIATATGKPSTTIDFVSGNTDKLQTITDFMNKGYGFVNVTEGSNPAKPDGVVDISPMTIADAMLTQNPDEINEAFGNYDTDDNTTQTFIIHLNHQVLPVSPDSPGQPGQPILEKNPNGPKFPDKTTTSDLLKTYTRTITYVVEGDESKAPATITENVTFSGEGYLDEVTGNWVNLNDDGTIKDENGGLTWTYSADTKSGQKKDGTGESYSLEEVPYVHIDGYHITGTMDSDKDKNGITPADQNNGSGGVKTWDINANTTTDNKLNVKIVYVANPKDAVPASLTVKYVDEDENNAEIPGTEYVAKGVKDEPVGYQTQDEIAKLEDQGYKYDKTVGKIPSTLDGDTVVTVYLKHAVQPINSNTPGPKPGDKINPKDPNSKTYPDDPKNPVNSEDLTKTITRTIHYVTKDANGKFTEITGHDEIPQKTQFTGTGYIDKVTGKWVKGEDDLSAADGITWSADQTLNGVKSPVVNGYHLVDVENKDGQVDKVDSDNNVDVKDVSVTHDTAQPYDVYVVYAQNGKIVPVDEKGNQIPDVDQPQYQNDPTDPTKVKSPETVPYVPGYTVSPKDKQTSPDVDPTKGRVTPSDPGKDTPVVYGKPETPTPTPAEQQATLKFVDDDNKGASIHNDLSVSGKEGSAITFTSAQDAIDALAAKGYVYKNVSGNGVTSADSYSNVKFPVFDGTSDQDKVSQVFTVHFGHELLPVTPENPQGQDPKTLTDKTIATVHYKVSDGKATAPEDKTETINWTKNETLDKVTNKLVPNGKYDKDWTPDKQSYTNVNTPVLNGYTADKGVADFSADTPTRGTNPKITITYSPNGHVIPVDEKGNPIPNLPENDTPQFPTDPNDPTKTTNSEKPSVPGYKPQTGQPGDPVKPGEKPTDNVTVPYVKDQTPTPTPETQTAVVNYIDQDNNNEQIATSGNLTGASDTAIKYSTKDELATLEAEGYVLVNNGFDPEGTAPNFDNDTKTTQTYQVILKHGTVTVTPNDPGKPGDKINPNDPRDPKDQSKYPEGTDKASLEKSGKQTVHYVISDGKTKAPADNVKNISFTKEMVIDKVTGKVVDQGKWNIDAQTYPAITSPTVSGYTPDETIVGGDTVKATDNSLDKTYTVTYTPNGKPINDLQHAVVVYQDVNDPVKTVELAKSGDLTGQPGDDVAKASGYSTADEIKALENKGYVLVNDGFQNAVFDNDNSVNQTYYVTFKHGTTTVDPRNPGDPTKPNDPNGPKHPTDYKTSDLTETITRTIHYQGAGEQTPNDVTQHVTFTKTGVYDNVTGQWVTPLAWDKDATTVNGQTSPTVNGYHVSGVDKDSSDGVNVDPATIKNDSKDYTVTVTYEKDKTPTPTPTPEKQIAVVNYIDQDANNQQIATSGDLTGDAGTAINYSTKDELATLEAEGYVLVNNGFDPDGKAPSFDNDTKNNQVFRVVLKHGTTTVTPKNPGDPKKPINPNDPRDPKDQPHYPTDTTKDNLEKEGTQTVHYVINDKNYKGQVPADSVNKVTFTKEKVIDNVTGKVIDQGKWNIDAQTYPTVKSPSIDGYTPNETIVGGDTVNAGDPNIDRNYTVTYTPNDQPVDHTQHAVVVYQDVNDPAKVVEITKSGDLTGQPGEKVNYSTADEIKQLENKGYVLVNDGFQNAVFDNNDAQTQTYYVTFKHGKTPVDPQHPGKPGQPVDPKNPDGPKYPADTPTTVTKDVTRTIHYEGAGDNTPKDVTQTVTFTQSGEFDNVTGKWITPMTWSNDQLVNGQKTPSVEGYHVTKVSADSKDNINVDAKTLTHGDNSYKVTVSYAPNGKIVPVLPDGKTPVPGNTKKPQYPTDPTDPSKVTPNEPVPDIPGYTPKVPTVTPQDPGKDTPVVYVPVDNTQTAQVIYQDVNDPDKVIQLATSGKLTGQPGEKVDYSTADKISELENKGYVLVNDGFQNAIFDNDDAQTQTYYVTFKHGTTPVDPQHPGKPGQPVDPKNPDGPKYPADTPTTVTKDVTRTIHYEGAGDNTPKDVTQTVTFTQSGEFDNVTGKWTTPMTWSNDQSVAGQTTPKVEGYHVTKVSADSKDNVNVDAKTLSHDDNNYTVTVSYGPNGKIVPVDPNGKPIPNAKTPTYPTDPTDPSKVTPNEPVPDVPGYTPKDPSPITPQDPGKDTPVVYVNDTQTARVIYQDVNDPNNVIELAKSDDLTGQPGEKINYSTADEIKKLEDQGYVLDNDGFQNAIFDNNNSSDQTFYVTFKHGTKPVTPKDPGTPGQPINPNDPNGAKYPDGTDKDSLTKTGTQTIHYVGAGDKTPENNVQTTEFDHEVVVDKVTGKIVKDNGWTPASHTFGTTKSPVVEGYHADKNVAGGKTVTADNPDATDVVIYAPNSQIIPVLPDKDDPTKPGDAIPNAPTPTYTTDPDDPTKVTPDEPVPDIPGYTPEVPTVTPQDPNQPTKVIYVKNNTQGSVLYIDDTTGKTIKTDQLEGVIGQKISYTTADKIQQLENQGYELVSNDFKDGQETFAKDGNNFTVHLKHATQTITPENPGTPGQPINPNDPNGAKYPDGTDKDSLTKTGTQTVHYVGAGSDTPADNVTTVQFSHDLVVDKVTGKVVEDDGWTPTSHSYPTVTTPKVDGYQADNDSVGGETVTIDPKTGDGDINKSYTVTYTSFDNGHSHGNGDDDGNSVQYAVINYIDQDDGNKQLASSGELRGKIGTKINYSTDEELQKLESQGYVLVKNEFSDDAVYSSDKHVYNVILKHDLAPVGPQNPHEPGTPVNPGDSDGPKWPTKDNYTKDYTSTVHFVDGNGNKVRDDNVQTSTWTRTLIIDKVTGKIVNPNTGWTSDKSSYDQVAVPVINGYVANKSSVPAKTTVQQNLEDTVVYNKLGNIVPVDSNGNQIPNASVKPYVNDPSDPTKVLPNEEVPAINGMIPSVYTVTPSDATKDTPVVYSVPATPNGDGNDTSAKQNPSTPRSQMPVSPTTGNSKNGSPVINRTASQQNVVANNSQNAQKLPQTGNDDSNKAGIAGLASVGLAGLLALGKKRKQD